LTPIARTLQEQVIIIVHIQGGQHSLLLGSKGAEVVRHIRILLLHGRDVAVTGHQGLGSNDAVLFLSVKVGFNLALFVGGGGVSRIVVDLSRGHDVSGCGTELVSLGQGLGGLWGNHGQGDWPSHGDVALVFVHDVLGVLGVGVCDVTSAGTATVAVAHKLDVRNFALLTKEGLEVPQLADEGHVEKTGCLPKGLPPESRSGDWSL
jgi:hypothetical protein